MSPAPIRLEERLRAVRAHLQSGAMRAFFLWTGALAALVLVAAWLLADSGGWPQGADAPLLLDAVFLAAVVAALVAVRRGVRRWFGNVPLTRAVEGAAGLPDGTVRGPLEFGRSVPPGVSAALVDRAAATALSRLEGSDAELSGDLGADVRRWTARGRSLLVAGVVLVVLLGVASPTRAGLAWAGLGRAVSLMADPVLPPIEVRPGDAEVLRGSDVEVTISAPGRAEVELAWQAAGDVARTGTVTLAEGAGVHRFPSVSARIEYRVRTADGAESGPFTLEPVDPLFVSDLRVEVAFPAHTGLPPEEFRGEVPPLSLPVGTRLRMEGRTSRPLSRAGLTDEDGEPVVDFGAEGLGFSATWTPRRGGRFPWLFLDVDGASAALQPDPLELTLEPDRPPTIAIPLPGVDTVIPLNFRQPLILEARDDYGLRRLELVAYRVTATGERTEPVTQSLDLEGTRAALARPLLDLSAWGLMPGDTVRYYATVADNGPTAQTARTRAYVLRMPGAAELRREAEAQLEDVARRLSELAEEAGERAEETRNLEREADAEEGGREDLRGRPDAQDEAGFEEREELRRAMEDQEALASEVDSLRAELESLQRAMEEAGQADPDFERDLDELQKLLEEVMEGAMPELPDPEQMQDAAEALEDLAEQQEAFRDRLEESLERFRRAAVEQDFRATQSEAEELARQQEALADALEEGDRPELRAEQQQGLEDRAEELRQRMDRLEERLAQLEEEDAALEVAQAQERAEDAQEQMRRAQAQARESRTSEAAEEARDAAESMERTAEELSEAQQQMQQQQAEAMMRAYQQAADDALSLARRQADLGEELSSAAGDRVAEMRADEAAVLQGLRNMAQNLLEGTEGAAQQNREVATQMGRAMESVQRTIDAMENRRGPSPSPQAAAERAVGDLNELALMALATSEAMGQGEGEGQAGSEQMSEKLQELAQQQGDMNTQTSELMPMQLGQEALAEQLRRLAEEQQSVADDLEGLQEEQTGEEPTLGDLEQLGAEAEALARALAEGRLTPDMTRRQERLFHRLLDAGRSLEREEYSDTRESERPGAFERGEVVPLTPEQLGALRFRLPDTDQLQRLPPAMRQLVIQYFERLNRGGGS